MLSQSSTGVGVVDAREDLLRASALANETAAPDITRLPIRRNVALLSAAVAANASTLQLTSAVASISLARLLDVEGLLGLGPALVLAAGALAAVPAGRAMDRRGRIPVLAAGFALGAASCGLAALGSADGSSAAVLAGLIGVGIANGPARLIRTAGGDMYPPDRRARGVALVLFGAVFGGILGPAVFGPFLAGRELDGDTLAALWLGGGALQLVALALVAAVRPDPKAIARLLGHESPAPTRPAAPLRDLLRRPGVVSALVAAQMSVGVMVGVMALTGPVIVDHFHHEPHDVFAIIGAQLLGMYALVVVVGGLVDRVGRAPSLSGGLLLMGLSVSSLLWLGSVPATAAAVFGLGLGWNVSFVAATAELTERTQSWERGRLLGFNDLLSGATGAALTLVGGLALVAAGVAALVIGAMALVAAPALWILGTEAARRRPVARTTDAMRRDSLELLDRAPKVSDEEALPRGEGEWWWRRHDEYAKG
jgi:MFS family permease